MKRYVYLFALCLSLCATVSHAQEICANGLDDDGDGFIDCFDKDCANQVVCTGGYVGNDLLCEAKPSQFPAFTLALESASPNGTANHLGRAVVGDIDGDGVPEMMTVNKFSKKIFILNGKATGTVNTIKKQLTVSFTPAYEDIAIANLNNGNGSCGEIFILGTDWSLYAYDCNLNQLWVTKLPGDPGTIGIADFNADGKEEIYARNAIYNAQTGATIVAPGGSWSSFNGGPVAVDVLNDATKAAHKPSDAVKDDNLELVCGGVIYSVNVAGGTINKEMSITNYGKRVDIDATSVADVNVDGSLDVVASGKDTNNGNTTIFFWDLVTGTVKTYSDPMAGNVTIQACPPATSDYYKNGWHQGTGRVNIADLDGDGKPNLAYVSGKYLYALKDDPANATKLVPLWPKITVFEETSGNTGCTLFDFNGDGKSEIVYRDEKFIYILDGTDGSVFTQQPCVSRTNREYPVVADVDADGSTELCVTCRTIDFVQNGTITNPSDPNYLTSDRANFCDINQAEFSQVRVFRSGGEPWVPARRVWNQHGYFNVNVNDNLTIPKVQQKHHLAFSENVCTVGKNRPLNSFLNQSPFLNSLGCPKYASPDLAFVDNSLTVNQPTCPSLTFTVSFKIKNKGDNGLSGDVPISFYDNDPTKVGANKLGTTKVTLNNLSVGAEQTLTNLSVSGPGSNFTLYIVLNDGGTTVPTPIKLPNTNFIECDYGNNIIQAPITPNPVALTAIKVQDNITCSGGTTPNNGAAEAYVMTGGVKNSTDYNFYWSIGTTAKPIASADFTGAKYTNIPGGTYTVYAIHKTAKCSSDTVQVVVGDIQSKFSIRIDLISGLINCKDNPNGHLDAVVLDGSGNAIDPSTNKYTFAWYQGTDVLTDPKIGNSHNIAGLIAITYSVLVIEKATGCQRFDSYNLPDNSVKPVLAASKQDALCTLSTSGKASALADGGTAGYTFSWYLGSAVKPSPDFTGDTWNNLAQGSYTVVATKNSTKCASLPQTVSIIQTTPPSITANATASQISCDMTAPTGAASVTPVGNITDFDYQWYTGQNTVNAISGATQNTVGGLSGNTYYTIKVKNKVTGCSATKQVQITDGVVPVSLLSIDLTANSKCVPTNGGIEVKTVSPDLPSDYDFFWYNGSSVKTASDYPSNKTNMLPGVPDGTYTVKAIHKIRKCTTPAKTITVANAIVPFVIALTDQQQPTDCTSPTGYLEAGVSTGNTNGYDFAWFAGGSSSGTPLTTDIFNTATSSKKDKIQQGNYAVQVTNRDNGCKQDEQFVLDFVDSHRLNFISQTDVTNCDPAYNNGAAVVELTRLAPGLTTADYDVFLYAGSVDPVSGAALATVPNTGPGNEYNTNPTTTLAPQSYTFVAVANAGPAAGCRAVRTVTVKQVTTDPAIDDNLSDASMINNTFCKTSTTLTGNGGITVAVTGSPTDFDYQWSTGATTQNIANVIPGDYSVRVTYNNTAAANIGCFTDRTFTIGNKPMQVSIDMANGDLTTTDVLHCILNSNNQPNPEGTVTFQRIQVDASTVTSPFAGYTFDWRKDDGTAVPDLDASANPDANSWDNASLASGSYYVVATDAASSCDVTASFDILNKAMNTVDVTLIAFQNEIHCVGRTTGSLKVLASGTSTTGYTYNWFDASGPVSNTDEVTGITSATLAPMGFNVVVTNNSTNCVAKDTYVVLSSKNPIDIDASSTPLVNCVVLDPVADNPKALAAVTFGGYDDVSGLPLAINQNDFTFTWTVDNVALPPQKEITLTVLDLNKPISVVATYNLDPTADPTSGQPLCMSSTLVVPFNDERVYPPVLAEALMPVTNCDPTIPNGVASASVNGDYINYDFYWFEGLPPVALPGGFYQGAQVDGLKAKMAPDNTVYTVLAKDRITGCTNTATIEINYSPVAIPMPQIEILSQLTSCSPGKENGALAVSVDKNISDYIFDWYIGQAEKVSPDFVGDEYDSLAVGIYSATATSRITGCKSPLVSEEIIFLPVYPEFDFSTVATHCTSPVDGLQPVPDGSLSLFITNSVEIDKIEWFHGTEVPKDPNIPGFVTGPLVTNIDAGDYSVRVTSLLGCPSTKTVSVKTDIRPFNGVSRNGDGANDIFYIGCIDNFENNLVKIFNRAGTLVYEAEGYDNSEIFFDGQSNKGISLMGTNLPGGTYYYIIDKRDGSKPMAGYLELIN
ncbi:MAG TPA: gliding motility-associated C-terminal domain-containing protein [Chryseolinea sp.]